MGEFTGIPVIAVTLSPLTTRMKEADVVKMERDWTSPTRDRTAHVIPRRELVLAADRAGAVIVSSPKLARLAGVGVHTAWAWLRGYQVSEETDRACRDALGLGVRPKPPKGC